MTMPCWWLFQSSSNAQAIYIPHYFVQDRTNTVAIVILFQLLYSLSSLADTKPLYSSTLGTLNHFSFDARDSYLLAVVITASCFPQTANQSVNSAKHHADINHWELSHANLSRCHTANFLRSKKCQSKTNMESMETANSWMSHILIHTCNSLNN